MGRDGLVVRVEIQRVLMKTIRIVYRSVKNHPLLVGVFLFLLFLYRSSPFLFSLLVSASPVLVCTAVLLGTLLSFGDSNISLIEDDEGRTSVDSAHLKMGVYGNTDVVEKDESCSVTDRFTELSKEIVERNVEKKPSLDGIDGVGKFEIDDVDVNLVLIDQNPREFVFEKGFIDDACFGVENLETGEQNVITDGQKTTMVGEEVGPSRHDEVADNRFSGILSENLEDYKSAEGSVDAQMCEDLEHSMSSWKRFDEVFEDKLSPVLKVQAAVHAQIRNQLESSFRSWKQLDEVVGDRLSSAQKAKTESVEDYKSAVDTMETHIRDQLESSMGSWKQVDSEKDDDDDDESDSESDGAESSSPDASLADILPMLDELDPLLEDESPQAVDQSHQSSDAMVARSGKSLDGSIHSDDECDQEGDEEAGDVKSDADDDDDDHADEGEETQSSKDDHGKSAISWTEDDQKNLMDLGTSEIERNHRLESLIARRRARKNLGMMADRNLIDFDGMDLQFPIAPISISRRNPFDFPQDSYDGLGLIPGSAPSVLAPRRNPFDLPYDSSEEKPDLMGDSFQEEFMELTQREASSQREPVFRRNETFSMGSSIFDFGRYDNRRRPSRFRPYFVPERTDSDSFSYSSLQRQLSELSESKLSSAAETDSPSAFDVSLQRQLSELSESKLSSTGETESTSAFGDEEAKKPIEHEIAQETEQSSELEHASLLVEHGSESSEDVHSLSDEENKHNDVILNEHEIELGRTENSAIGASHVSETGLSDEIKLDDRENHFTEKSIKEQVTRSRSSSSLSDESNGMKVEDEDEDLMGGEQTQASNIEADDALVVNPLQASAVSTSSVKYMPTLESSLSTELDDGHQKEPVYDLSPQAVKKNHSSSSSSSDLFMEMSEIDSHHLSTIQRDLFVDEESKDHKEHVELNALDRKEDNELDDSCEFQFPVAIEHPINFEAPVLPQCEVNLRIDSFNDGLVNESGDANVSLDGGQNLNQKDDGAGVCSEANLDAAKSENDISSAAEPKPFEDVYFGFKERDISTMTECTPHVQPETSYSEVEHEDESPLHNGDHQFLASSSDLKNDENNVNREILATSLDEAHQVAVDSAIHNPCDESEDQELPTFHGKLEEAEVENVNETVNTVLVQEPEEFGKEPIIDMEEHSHANSLGELGVLASDEKLPFDLMDIKEMDDDLLTELDAVGDFSVKDLGSNLNVNEVQLNREVDFCFSQEMLDEGYSIIQKPFIHDTFLEAGTSVENYKATREITQPSSPTFEESHLDSHTRDADNGLTVLEAASVEDIDAAFLRACEGEFQNSVTTESLGAELTLYQVEGPHQESELVPEVIEQVTDGAEEVYLRDTAFVNEESPAESVRSDITSVDEEIFEHADEKIERMVETETQIFSHAESLQPTGNNEFDSMEPALSQIDRDMTEIHELSSSEEGIASAFESDTQVERAGFVEYESLQINLEINEAEHLAGVQDSHQTERIGLVESEPLDRGQESEVFQENPADDMHLAVESVLIGRDIKENQEFPIFETNIAHFVDSIDQIENSDSLESESLLIEGDVKQILDQTEIPSYVESQSLPTDRDLENVPELHVLEENSVGQMDSDSSLIARDSEEVQEPFVVEEEKVDSMESDLRQLGADIKYIQSHVNLSSESVVESEDQIEDIQHMEVVDVQASSQDHQFLSQQQTCDLTEVDSVTTPIDSTGNVSSPGKNEDGESNESHLKFSSNSTASSST